MTQYVSMSTVTSVWHNTSVCLQ